MIQTTITKLDTQYVLTKKFNGKIRYYGKYYKTYSSDHHDARFAVVYNTLEEAQKQCDLLNSTRKKLKLKVDKASKHFLSSFHFTFSTWGYSLSLKNVPISLTDFKLNKAKQNDAKASAWAHIKTIESHLAQKQTALTQALIRFEQDLEALKARQATEKAKIEHEIEQLQGFKQDLETFDFNWLDQQYTTDDKTFMVLFGNKGQTNGNT